MTSMSTNAKHNGDDQDAVPRNSPEFPIGQNRLNAEGVSLNDTALSARQRMAIELLATGKSLSVAARMIEIDRKTLYNWRRDATFREALYERRRELWSDAIDRVRGMVQPSLDIIEQHLADRYERVRFRAAQTVLNLASLKKHAADANGTPGGD